nr:hypothetical protein [Gammaproteobacteria bacterium]
SSPEYGVFFQHLNIPIHKIIILQVSWVKLDAFGVSTSPAAFFYLIFIPQFRCQHISEFVRDGTTLSTRPNSLLLLSPSSDLYMYLSLFTEFFRD